jgi:uncharacterized protein (TIGR02271 family)
MALIKIKDFNSNYQQEFFGGKDLKQYGVYTDINDQKVGSVYDVLVDEYGHLRYLVIDAGWWSFGKKVLLPIGQYRIDYGKKNIYAFGLTKEQVEALPNYNDGMVLDRNYEERVKAIYRSPESAQTSRDRATYSYPSNANSHDIREEDNASIKLYKERLTANKNRYKTGEVALGKTVKTETARVAVPIEKERVIIEQRNFDNGGQVVAPDEVNFREEEIVRMEVYEETANIRKEAFLSGEVSVKKAVEHETVTAEEMLRREELKLDVDGEPIINKQQ